MCGNVLIGETTQLFPRFLFLCFLFIILGINIYYFRKKDKKKLLKLIVFTIFGLFSSFAIHIFSLSSFGAGRLHVSIGMTIGYIFLMFYVSGEVFAERKPISYFLQIILICYLLINIINFYKLTYDHQTVNKIDRQQVEKIEEYIEKYEKESGTEVKYITMRYFSNTKKGYFKNKNSINTFAIYSECSFDGIINFYTGRKLQRVTLTPNIYQKYLEQINGNEYKTLCVGNVLVCPVYNL